MRIIFCEVTVSIESRIGKDVSDAKNFLEGCVCARKVCAKEAVDPAFFSCLTHAEFIRSPSPPCSLSSLPKNKISLLQQTNHCLDLHNKQSAHLSPPSDTRGCHRIGRGRIGLQLSFVTLALFITFCVPAYFFLDAFSAIVIVWQSISSILTRPRRRVTSKQSFAPTLDTVLSLLSS